MVDLLEASSAVAASFVQSLLDHSLDPESNYVSPESPPEVDHKQSSLDPWGSPEAIHSFNFDQEEDDEEGDGSSPEEVFEEHSEEDHVVDAESREDEAEGREEERVEEDENSVKSALSDSDLASSSAETSDDDAEEEEFGAMAGLPPPALDLQSYLSQECEKARGLENELLDKELTALLSEVPPEEEILSHLATAFINLVTDHAIQVITRHTQSYHTQLLAPSSTSPPATASVLLRQSSSFRKREGIMYKRATFESSGRLLISGGESGNYTIATNTETFNLKRADTKVVGLCFYDIVFGHPERVLEGDGVQEEHQRRMVKMMRLSECTVTVTVSYNHTMKISHYPSDGMGSAGGGEGRIQRRKYQLSGKVNDSSGGEEGQSRSESGKGWEEDKKRWIAECIWSKLHLKDEKWRNVEVRNYQVSPSSSSPRPHPSIENLLPILFQPFVLLRSCCSC
jgi:hypothetical protein